MDRYAIIHGDCLEVMRGMDAASVDAIVTDPPYGLSFMGKDWDHGVPGVHFWEAALRVAKPGTHLLAFGGTRTFHRLACAIEDAGWEIRDTVMWVYAQGFPKSHNLKGDWSGWGTALKPSYEPVIVARKPLDGTVAENVTAYGTGAINVDGCRIPTDGEVLHAPQSDPFKRGAGAGEFCVSTRDVSKMHDAQRESIERTNTIGRWPANLIHDGSDEVVGLFPNDGEQSAARFFYAAKASRRDRNEGCDGFEEKLPPGSNGSPNAVGHSRGSRSTPRENHHPTVKPTALMRYLCRLVTPPGGIVLDPFAGSGSTGKGAVLEGFNFIGIELDAEYCKIARARIANAAVVV